MISEMDLSRRVGVDRARSWLSSAGSGARLFAVIVQDRRLYPTTLRELSEKGLKFPLALRISRFWCSSVLLGSGI